MKYELDPQLNTRLRDSYNRSHFASMVDTDFNKPSISKKREKISLNASNCICACLDRIDSLVFHCNELFTEKDTAFKLCDILNYGQTLIDCIEMLAKIFNVPYEKAGNQSCFHEDEKGSDREYFKYIRSLCSVHPIETSMHASFQGEEPEWSPWIDTLSGSTSGIFRLLADDKEKVAKADYAIVVYRNDIQFNKYVYISLEEVFNYLEKRYLFIEDIIKAIDILDDTKIRELCDIEISHPESFDSYYSYIDYLVEELARRGMGDFSWQANEWKTIFESKFEDDVLDSMLDQYKKIIKNNIEELKNKAQRMDFDSVREYDVVKAPYGNINNKYAYCVEKIHYLIPCWECEDFSVKEIVSIHEYKGDTKRLGSMLDDVEKLRNKNNTVSEANILIESKYHTDSSEWARVQLKWIEQYYNTDINYYLSDWYLYLLLLITDKE